MYPETYALNIFLPKNTFTLMVKIHFLQREKLFCTIYSITSRIFTDKSGTTFKENELADLIFHSDRHENKPNEDNADEYINI